MSERIEEVERELEGL